MLDTELARQALFSIPPDLPRDKWVKASMGAHAAGLDFETFNDWSAQGGNYDPTAARDTWRSIKPGKGIGPGTLFKIAAAHGWRLPGRGERPAPAPAKRAAKPAPEARQTVNTAELWGRCEPAPAAHPYILAKAADGVPLDGLRVVPDGDPLRIAGESMAGALVVPVLRADGSPSSLQFVAPPATADRLKAKGKPGKLNLPGATLDGWFTVGELAQGGAVYLCEGIGQAWACWKATGRAAVVCFGWGRVRAVADPVALAGTLTPKAWTDKDGNARPALDLVAHGLVTPYHVTRKRRAVAAARGPAPATGPDGQAWPDGGEPWES